MKEGKSFSVGNLRFRMNELNEIQVSGWSQYTNLKNITKQSALKELQEIKVLFFEMVESSKEFGKFIEDRSIEFVLFF